MILLTKLFLIIGPSGIEILLNHHSPVNDSCLIIGPSGIEISMLTGLSRYYLLLIIGPSGIDPVDPKIECKHVYKKESISIEILSFSCCGGKTRTYDLWVMSPTSYQLLHSAMFYFLIGLQRYIICRVNQNFSSIIFPISV